MALWMLSYHLNISEFIIRWISHGSHNLTCYYHCCFFLNDTTISWVLSSHLWILYRHVSPLQCHFQTFAGVAMKCTLHCHSILTTPLPLRSVNAVLICDALQCHSGVTLQHHSNATPKVHFNATPECTLHCHSITTTPMPLSQNTPMPLRSVFGVLICIFATHSYATPIPLHKVGVAS